MAHHHFDDLHHPHDHGHAHDHDHGHGHGHGLGTAPADFTTAFAIGVALNVAFVVAETGFGIAAHSVALLADAGHNLSDVLGLLVAWAAALLSRSRPTRRFTYGLGASSILAALFNAMLLFVVVGAILLEAVQRLLAPAPVGGLIVILVAAAGIVVNGATALLFMSGRHGDLNVRGVFIHMAGDAGISAGVAVAGLIIMATGWYRLDPLVSVAIGLAILWSTWSLARDSIAMALSAVPPGIDPAKVRATLTALPGVESLHDLHIWPMSTTETSLTAHLLMPGGYPGDAFLMTACERLRHDFGIGHVTLQIETSNETHCALAPEDVV